MSALSRMVSQVLLERKKRKALAKKVKSKENWKYCAARNCKNSEESNPALQFFRFPKNPNRCREWAVNVGREDLLQVSATALHTKKTVCASHFELSQFTKGTKMLIERATPTLFNPKTGSGKTWSSSSLCSKKNLGVVAWTMRYKQLSDQRKSVKIGSKQTPQLDKLLTCVAQVNCSQCSKDIWISCQPQGHVMMVLHKKEQQKTDKKKRAASLDAEYNCSSSPRLNSDRGIKEYLDSSANDKEHISDVETVAPDMSVMRPSIDRATEEVLSSSPGDTDKELTGGSVAPPSAGFNTMEQTCTQHEEEAGEEDDGDIAEPTMSVPQNSSAQVESGHKVVMVKKELEEICAEHPELLTRYSVLSCMGQEGSSVMQLSLQSSQINSKHGPMSNSEISSSRQKRLEELVPCRLQSSHSQSKPAKARRKQKDLDHPKSDYMYHCEMCNRNLRGKRSLYCHIQGHTLPKTHICTICGKAYKKKSDMLRHIRFTHERVKDHQCDTCGKRFQSSYLLKIHHNASHLKVRQFVCHLCGMAFSLTGNLKRHLQWHTGKKGFSCDYCGRQFFQKSPMLSHERTHTGEVPWCCEICGRGFQAPGVLKKHLAQHAAGTIDDTYRPRGKQLSRELCKCEICGLSFRGKLGVTHHMRSHQEAESLKCDICGMVVSDKDALTMHKESAHDVVRFKCSKCGKSFETYAMLSNHRQVAHRSRADLTCDICNRSFSTRHSRILHAQTHTGVKLFPCNVCGKKFGCSGNLQRHQRVHTGEKPYKCDICGRGFAQSNAMKEHHKTHAKKTTHFHL